MPGRAGSRGDGRGATRLGILAFLLVVAALGYLAAVFIPPYWTYLSMFDPVKEAALDAARGRGEERARATLLARARDLGLELPDEGVEFVRQEAEQVVRVTWDAPVDLPRYRHTLRFHIEKRSLLP